MKEAITHLCVGVLKVNGAEEPLPLAQVALDGASPPLQLDGDLALVVVDGGRHVNVLDVVGGEAEVVRGARALVGAMGVPVINNYDI